MTLMKLVGGIAVQNKQCIYCRSNWETEVLDTFICTLCSRDIETFRQPCIKHVLSCESCWKESWDGEFALDIDHIHPGCGIGHDLKRAWQDKLVDLERQGR